MEGVTHSAFRETLCLQGGVDFCVTEFIRVTTQLHPKKVFYRFCPELKTSHKAGPRVYEKTPIFIQLLGSQPEALLVNALRAIELGAKGIDLNFGCPAKIVNRNQGGAYLLQYPQQIAHIAQYLRSQLPPEISLSAKIRLGYTDSLLLKDIVQAIDSANLSWLTVHCRTKKDGYAPPAYWEYIPQIKNWTQIPVVANGDIFSIQNLITCYQQTHCQNFMIGRGIIYNPWFFAEINHFLKNYKLSDHLSDSELQFYKNEITKEKLLTLLRHYFQRSCLEVNEYYATAKVKGWLKSISQKNSQFRPFFDSIKTLKPPSFKEALYKENINYEANS